MLGNRATATEKLDFLTAAAAAVDAASAAVDAAAAAAAAVAAAAVATAAAAAAIDPAAAAAAVDAAGKPKAGSERTKSRRDAAFKNGIQLVKRTNTPAPGTAALSKAGEPGFDMVVQVGDVAHHGQTKGREVGPAAGAQGDAPVIPSEVRDILKGLKTAISGQDGETPAAVKRKAEDEKGNASDAAEGEAAMPKGKNKKAAAARGKDTVAKEATAAAAATSATAATAAIGVPVDAVMRLELLFAGRVSTSFEEILAGCPKGDADTQKMSDEISRELGDKSSAVVMMRAELKDALGPAFGGIAARCHKDSAKKVAGAAAATGAAVGSAVSMDEEEDEATAAIEMDEPSPSALPGDGVVRERPRRTTTRRAGSAVVEAGKIAPPTKAPKKDTSKK